MYLTEMLCHLTHRPRASFTKAFLNLFLLLQRHCCWPTAQYVIEYAACSLELVDYKFNLTVSQHAPINKKGNILRHINAPRRCHKNEAVRKTVQEDPPFARQCSNSQDGPNPEAPRTFLVGHLSTCSILTRPYIIQLLPVPEASQKDWQTSFPFQ